MAKKKNQNYTFMVAKGFLNPLCYEDPPYIAYPPLIQILFNYSFAEVIYI